MIMEPDKREDNSRQEQPADKLTGPFKRTALVAAAAELIIYWLLVIRFPAAMVPVSVVLGGIAWFFLRSGSYLASIQQEMKLSPRDMQLLHTYCKAWIYIAAYGAAFALFLLWRG